MSKSRTVRKINAACPVAILAQQYEALCLRHEAADNASVLGKSTEHEADLNAYNFEWNAIAERASYTPARSAQGAALQLAFAHIDADILTSTEFSSPARREAHIDRMKRLFKLAYAYLAATGGTLPLIVASYSGLDPRDPATVNAAARR